MSDKNRVEIIREGNRLFNEAVEENDESKLKKATLKFNIANYQDGLFRVADYLYYDRRLPLYAISYYKKINTSKAKQRIDEISARFILAFKTMMLQDEYNTINEKGQSILEVTQKKN